MQVSVAGANSPDEPHPLDPALEPVGAESIVAHRGWSEARTQVLAAALAGHNLILVLGAGGTGKSLLLQDLARTLEAAGADVLLVVEGDLPADAIQARPAGKRRIVLIDDADRMTGAALERLGWLIGCVVVLAGRTDPGGGTGEYFPGAAIVRLAPLPADEVGAFLAAWLAGSGRQVDFDAAAMARLAACSGGVPRTLNTLAERAIGLAQTRDADRVGAEHVQAVDDGDTLPPASNLAGKGSAVILSPFGVAPFVAAPLVPQRRAAGLRQAALVVCVVAGVVSAGVWLALERGGNSIGELRVKAVLASAFTPHRQAAAVSRELPISGVAIVSAPALATAALPPAREPPAPQAAASSQLVKEPLAAPAMALHVTAADSWDHAAPPDPLPLGALVRVMLRYARTDAGAAVRAESLAASLRAAGFVVDDLPSDRPGARPGVHYFFAEDRSAAETVLRAAGLTGAASLAYGSRAVPPFPGLIELITPTQAAPVRPRPPGDGRPLEVTDPRLQHASANPP